MQNQLNESEEEVFIHSFSLVSFREGREEERERQRERQRETNRERDRERDRERERETHAERQREGKRYITINWQINGCVGPSLL